MTFFLLLPILIHNIFFSFYFQTVKSKQTFFALCGVTHVVIMNRKAFLEFEVIVYFGDAMLLDKNLPVDGGIAFLELTAIN